MQDFLESLGIGKHRAEEASDVYYSIKMSNLWNYIKSDDSPRQTSGGFVFCRDPELQVIFENCKLRHHHSAASYASALRLNQFLVCQPHEFVETYYNELSDSEKEGLKSMEDCELKLMNMLVVDGALDTIDGVTSQGDLTNG